MSKVEKTEDQWKQELTPEQYTVLRGKGTEVPFSGELVHEKTDGMYACAACGSELFTSDTKFDSRTGWPSFYDALPGKVEMHDDGVLGMARVEVTCATCGGHLGHVFSGENFGNPTDKRFCINSLSLGFKPKQ